MGRTILVVDDEPRIREILAAYLRRDGYEPLLAATGEDALDLLGRREPALVLLDLGLPDLDGLEVLRRMRSSWNVPVILVTARAEEVDRLVGLQVGADDYVTKPFSPREVVARVTAVLRRARAGQNGEGDRDFPDLSLSSRRREVVAHGKPVPLSALEFDLLDALTAHPGTVLTRSTLLHQV